MRRLRLFRPWRISRVCHTNAPILGHPVPQRRAPCGGKADILRTHLLRHRHTRSYLGGLLDVSTRGNEPMFNGREGIEHQRQSVLLHPGVIPVHIQGGFQARPRYQRCASLRRLLRPLPPCCLAITPTALRRAWPNRL
jgi:hypothetical protein